LKRRFIRYAAVAAAIVLLINVFALPRLGSWLVRQDPLETADAIIVLGGTMYERPLEAADLLKEGFAPRIFLFREYSDWGEEELIARGVPYVSTADVQMATLQRLGVPQDRVELLDRAGSTADEAGFVQALVTQRKFSRVIIVTSKQHTRRARLVMHRRLAGTGTTVIVRASRYDRSDVERWWDSRATLRFTLFETQRLIAYWIGIAD
jgi:uncharacterized SAM-binding protein YcdF (DUF218 family)